MAIYTSYLTKNDCYKSGKKIHPQGIMVHSTGANNPNLRRYVQSDDPTIEAMLGPNNNHNDWNRPGTNACVHAFIGRLANGEVATIQTLPWDMRGWHAGTGTSGKSANNTHISFEICEDGLYDANYFGQTFEEAARLVASLCHLYDLNPMRDGVIICHQDGYKRGIASNHGDIYNWWPKFGKDMGDFRNRVWDILHIMGEDNMKYYRYLDDVPEWYKPSIEKCINAGALQGTGDGEINVSEDLCRTMTILDRMGKL